MYSFREYQTKQTKLADYLPYAALVAPGVILNKDGSFQKSFRFRGPDLDSATQSELVVVAARINNVLKRIPGNWAVFTEAQRRKSREYPESKFPDPITVMIDEERKGYFEAGNHYESEYYFTLLYMPPQENADRLESLFLDRIEDREAGRKTGLLQGVKDFWQSLRNEDALPLNQRSSYESHLKTFQVEAERVYLLFNEVMPEAQPLTDEQTLTYLHSCVSGKRHTVAVPETPMYLDAFLVDQPLLGGMQPKLGNQHLRTISVLGFPGSSMPGLMDNLNRLNFEYRWATRYIPLDKVDALKEINSYKRKWFSKRKSIVTLLKETIFRSESLMMDSDAVNKAVDSDEAAQAVAADYVSYGYFTMTVTVLDEDPAQVEKKVRAVEKTINSLGFTVICETLNAVEAWLGSLPGHCRANVRRPLMSSLNLAHLFPLSAVWAGPETNGHLDAPPLMHTQTSGNTPFRLNLHVGDVGHTMVVGPTGAGKSVLLAMLAAQFRRYRDSQVYFFDKGGSCRSLTAGVGGDFYDLAAEDDGMLSFQPLADIDDEKERSWAAEWIYDFLRGENVEIDPDVKKNVWTALTSLATSPREQRTITGFVYLLQDAKLRQALLPATLDGAFGRLFDSTSDNLSYGRWQAFEMEQLMHTPAAVAPTLNYLFHRLEQRFQGAPTLLVLDECWLFLDNPLFAAKIREWLKVLRKANVAVVFATQSLQDVMNSSIAAAILDSCPTKIYLPNVNALDSHAAEVYHAFGLNDREREILALATPKRQYYYKSERGSRLFELTPGPVTLAYCAASGKEDQRAVRELLAEHGKERFNAAWLRLKNLPDVARVIEEVTETAGRESA